MTRAVMTRDSMNLGAFRRWRWDLGPLRAALESSPYGRVAAGIASARRSRSHSSALRREVAVVADLIAVGVSAGHTPYLAVEVAARWSPPLVRAPLSELLRSVALGSSFPDALFALGLSIPELCPLTDELATAHRLGIPAGPGLERIAAESRATARRRAQEHSRAVPVRLLFPLVFLILPAFGLLTVVPALISGLAHL